MPVILIVLGVVLAGCAVVTDRQAPASGCPVWARPIELSERTKAWVAAHLDDRSVRADAEAIARHNIAWGRICGPPG